MKVDHWLWCANGLQGIASMLEKIASGDVPPSPEAITHLKQQVERLKAILNKAETKGQEHDHITT